jgi:hypothetical protein
MGTSESLSVSAEALTATCQSPKLMYSFVVLIGA